MAKPRIIKDFDKVGSEIQNRVKGIYPTGFSQHLVTFTNRDGEQRLALPFETEEHYYLLRISESRMIGMTDDDFEEPEAPVDAELDEDFDTADEEYDPYADRDVEAKEEEVA